MSDTIAPDLGDWLISPSGKKWRVVQIRDFGVEPVYEVRRATTDSKRQGPRRDMYLRELARWRKCDD